METTRKDARRDEEIKDGDVCFNEVFHRPESSTRVHVNSLHLNVAFEYVCVDPGATEDFYLIVLGGVVPLVFRR